MNIVKPNSAKAVLRKEVAERIAKLTTEEKKRQSDIIFNKLINHDWYKASNRIAIYMSTPDEVDTQPIINHIRSRGASAFVPQYAGGTMQMLKLVDDDIDNMPKTKHGIKQHAKDTVRDEALETGGLDLIVTPGVAFTKSCARCGHGGGYYDKYIQKCLSFQKKPKLVALAFDCQIYDEIPTDEHDQLMDYVINRRSASKTAN